MNLKIYCLGGFQLVSDGRQIARTALGGTKARQLLKVLLTRPGATFTRDQLIEALWPEGARPKDPDRTLRNYVWQLRKALEPEAANGEDYRLILTGEDGSYGFFPTPECWIDVQAFERALDAGEQAAAEGRWIEAIDPLQQALELYRGDLFEEDRYEDWAIPRREALREACGRGLARLAEACAQTGAWREALAPAQRAAALQPGHEGVHRPLMVYACRAGNRDLAIRTFHALEAYLAERLEVEPELETKQLFECILANELPGQTEPAGSSAPGARVVAGRKLVGAIFAAAVLLVALVWGVRSLQPGATVSSAAPIRYFQGDAGAFRRAADFPPVVVDFDDLAPGTDLSGRTLEGVRFERGGAASAPLLVAAGDETFTPPGYRCEPLGDPDSHKLFPTTGGHVLSPGGPELAPGPNPSLEDDDLVFVFEHPVHAVGFDILWQSADGAARTVTLYDAADNVLAHETVRFDLGAPGVAPPGGSLFVGFVADENAIARVAVDELDGDNCRQDANAGYDTLRFAHLAPRPRLVEDYAYVREWGGPGANPGQFSEDAGPRGLAVVEAGGETEIYVADYLNKRIQRFDPEGRLLGVFSLPAVLGDAVYGLQDLESDGRGAFYLRAVDNAGGYLLQLDGELNVRWRVDAPAAEWVSYGLCVDSDGNVHLPVAHSTKPLDHRMRKYAPDGRLLLEYGAGLVKGNVSCEASPQGFLYVGDGTSTNLRRFDNDGRLLDTVRIGHSIQAIAIERESRAVYLSLGEGEGGTRVRKYDADFTPLAEWGGPGPGGGLLSDSVRDLELDARGRVYVSDGKNHLIQVFEPR